MDTQVNLHQGQLDTVASTARTTVDTWGQGSGKTTAGYWWVYGRMRVYPGEAWFIGFPDYGLLNQTILEPLDPDRPTLLEFLESVGEKPHLQIVDRIINCKSGNIFFQSSENLTRWEGAHVKGAWIDEFDETPLGAYRRAMERTRMRQGQVLLTGTLRKMGWIKTELQPRWESGDPTVKRIQLPSTANPAYPPAAMEEARRTLPWWEYARLYLGELAEMEGGNLFHREWWQRYDTPPSPPYDDLVQCWDTAFKTKTRNSYSVCGTWARIKHQYYLLDVWRGKVEYPALLVKAKDLYQQWHPHRVRIEDKASGQSLIQDLQHSTGIPVIAVNPEGGDKYARASAVTGLVESGRTFLPESAPWVSEYIEEMATFPESEFTDQVDMTWLALSYFKSRVAAGSGLIVVEKKESAWRR